MAIPSTDVALVGDGTTPGLFYEANLSSSPPSSGASLNTLSFFSYFAGPSGGGGSIDYNCYGRGEGSGANRILGTNAVGSSNVDMDDFKGITYFYDNSTFQVTLQSTNNIAPLPNPPNPPGSNDVNVTVELYDSNLTLQYISGGGMVAENGGTFGPNAISQTNDPIIFRGYWKVTVAGAGPMFGGGSCDIVINGNTKVTGGTVAAGPGGSTFDSATYGTEDVVAYGGYTGLLFDITVY
jgi:hypothetical protein